MEIPTRLIDNKSSYSVKHYDVFHFGGIFPPKIHFLLRHVRGQGVKRSEGERQQPICFNVHRLEATSVHICLSRYALPCLIRANPLKQPTRLSGMKTADMNVMSACDLSRLIYRSCKRNSARPGTLYWFGSLNFSGIRRGRHAWGPSINSRRENERWTGESAKQKQILTDGEKGENVYKLVGESFKWIR